MEGLWPIWTTHMQAREEKVTSYVLFNVEVAVGKATNTIYSLYLSRKNIMHSVYVMEGARCMGGSALDNLNYRTFQIFIMRSYESW